MTDFSGYIDALQFKMLIEYGLKPFHTLLEIHCGDLHTGKFFIMYLYECNYHGLAPDMHLVHEGVRVNTGDDLIKLKRPVFHINIDAIGDVQFDYVLFLDFSIQSDILIDTLLAKFRRVLKPDGKLIGTTVNDTLAGISRRDIVYAFHNNGFTFSKIDANWFVAE